MKKVALLALGLVFAGAAMAQDATKDAAATAASTKTRAEVKAETKAAAKSGQMGTVGDGAAGNYAGAKNPNGKPLHLRKHKKAAKAPAAAASAAK